MVAVLQACKLKLGDAQGALADCEYAMQSGVENVKALFRQGQVRQLPGHEMNPKSPKRQ
jgi:peptidyl-prolyl isomerase D